MTIQVNAKKISITCPICQTKGELEISDSIIKETSHLTTISVPRSLVCDHHFQIFIDKNLKVRGYQKVDYEIILGRPEHKCDNIKPSDFKIEKENEFFDNLLIDGNYLEYQIKGNLDTRRINLEFKESSLKRKELSLEEFYEEFWEFIDSDNLEFEKFILKDKRREKLS